MKSFFTAVLFTLSFAAAAQAPAKEVVSDNITQEYRAALLTIRAAALDAVAEVKAPAARRKVAARYERQLATLQARHAARK